MSFVTNDNDLTIPQTHNTSNATATGQTIFTKSFGNYNCIELKLTNTTNPIYVTALSAPRFTQNLINIGQIAKKHTAVFNKECCYLLDPSATPSTASILGVRGPDKLYRLKDVPKPLYKNKHI